MRMGFICPDNTPASPAWQSGPGGAFSPYTYDFGVGSFSLGSGIYGANAAAGGANYADTLPGDGGGVTINMAPAATSGGSASSTFSTTIKPGSGEITQTETVKVEFHVTDQVFNEVVNAIGSAISAVGSAIWSGISDVVHEGEDLASSFGGWLWKTFGGSSSDVVATPAGGHSAATLSETNHSPYSWAQQHLPHLH